jgi:hypothetical protein
MRVFDLTRTLAGRHAALATLGAGVAVAIVVGCSNAPAATNSPTAGGTVPALATPGASATAASSVGASGSAAATPAAPTQAATSSAPSPAESAVVGPSPEGSAPAGSSPIAGGQPTGQPITGPSQYAQVLGPGDFAAVGVADAHAPTVNTTGCAPNCAYVVYNKLSSADGGIEFDVFNYDTAADAASDFSGGSLNKLDAASLAALGADDAQLQLAVPGNTADIKVDELSVLKGKLWFDLGIPSNEKGKSQLLALAALVLARTGPLQ